ncbi:unnamed protein product [Rhizoctonia solani]|uniref:SRP9 domain-containing protein n=1 Tax=Rhizoctonia solani TaxID=456999 RepID=A0A8H3CRV0_9AGAM|nr:unnamed protein product [Rhizoctonia solani]
MGDVLYPPRIGFGTVKWGKLFPHDTSVWPFSCPSLGYYSITCVLKCGQLAVIHEPWHKHISIVGIGVFLSLGERVCGHCGGKVELHGIRTRYVVKWKPALGVLVLKITDDESCLKFRTHSSIMLGRFETLNLELMRKMQNRTAPPPPAILETAVMTQSDSAVPSSVPAPGAGAAKKKKPKKKK